MAQDFHAFGFNFGPRPTTAGNQRQSAARQPAQEPAAREDTTRPSLSEGGRGALHPGWGSGQPIEDGFQTVNDAFKPITTPISFGAATANNLAPGTVPSAITRPISALNVALNAGLMAESPTVMNGVNLGVSALGAAAGLGLLGVASGPIGWASAGYALASTYFGDDVAMMIDQIGQPTPFDNYMQRPVGGEGWAVNEEGDRVFVNHEGEVLAIDYEHSAGVDHDAPPPEANPANIENFTSFDGGEGSFDLSSIPDPPADRYSVDNSIGFGEADLGVVGPGAESGGGAGDGSSSDGGSSESDSSDGGSASSSSSSSSASGGADFGGWGAR